MNIKVIQPPYPHRVEDTVASVTFMINELEKCDDKVDLVLLPECCNAPSGCGDGEILKRLAAENTEKLLFAAKKTAKRCKTIVGINLYLHSDNDEILRNATILIDTEGELAAKYDKLHLPISEYTNAAIDHSYIAKAAGPCVAEIEGVRYAFLTCYDMYYTELFNRIAIEQPDVVIVCSLQRAERYDILETEAKTCAFLCNAFVVRSSYYMGEGATTGSCSMIVAPDGKVLYNFGNNLGSFVYEIEDIHFKYSRSNGFGQPLVSNDSFQTMFRIPWVYRAAGSGVIPGIKQVCHPHLCADSGFGPGAPANTLPSVAIAISMGASEIALHVYCTQDGVPVLCDNACQKITGSKAEIPLTLAELKSLDPGNKFSCDFAGVRYATVEEVFSSYPRRTIFNLLIPEFEKDELCKIALCSVFACARKYDCLDHVYVSSDCVQVLETAEKYCKGIERCYFMRENPSRITETAIAYHCAKIQTRSSLITGAMIEDAHRNGLRVNALMDSDDSKASLLLKEGVDCIITDHYLKTRTALDLA